MGEVVSLLSQTRWFFRCLSRSQSVARPERTVEPDTKEATREMKRPPAGSSLSGEEVFTKTGLPPELGRPRRTFSQTNFRISSQGPTFRVISTAGETGPTLS